MSHAQRVDVEEGERFVGFEELHRRDLSFVWAGSACVGRQTSIMPTLDDLAEDTGGRHNVCDAARLTTNVKSLEPTRFKDEGVGLFTCFICTMT